MSDPSGGAWSAGGFWGLAAVSATAVVAGAVNSVAGGGTILTFPVLVALLPAGPAQLVIANATSTIGLWPGALAAAWAYRGERPPRDVLATWLLVPSIAGAVVGTLLVLWLPPRWFSVAVPWLILAAAVLFALQPRLVGFAARQPGGQAAGRGLLVACLLQCAVAVYGGYFGAGIGILMLALLGLLGLGDIHRLNAVKNLLGTVINGVSAAVFATGALTGGHAVAWPYAAALAVGAVLGGLAGSHVARRLPATFVRRVVAVIGFGLAVWYFWRDSLA